MKWYFDKTTVIKGVDGVNGLLVAGVTEMWGSHRCAMLLLDRVEGAVGHITGVSGRE